MAMTLHAWKWFERLLLAALAAGMAMMLALMVWWHFLQPAGSIVETAARLDRQTYRPGDIMRITRRICIDTRHPVTIERTIANRDVHYLPMLDIRPVQGCRERTYPVALPRAIEPGRHEYIVTARIHVNPFRTDTVLLTRLPFEIVE